MSITDPNSVLIIGAGASADFGLPLGGPLLSEVRDELLFQVEQMENRNFRRQQRREFDWASLQNYREPTGVNTRDYPIWLWLSERTALEETEREGQYGQMQFKKRLGRMMTSVANLLNEQTSETIDDFIAMNPETAEIVKMAISCVFYRILYPDGDEYSALRKVLHPRYLEVHTGDPKNSLSRRNWIHLLINIVRHAAYNETLANGQKIKIISFNYDGILESVLDSQFGNTGHDFKPWRDYIEIVHPHGWMGDLPETCSDMKSRIEGWANAINVVNEKDASEEVSLARQTASEWIKHADKIYMAGFALSAPNAKMLGMGRFGRMSGQDWYIHNYDGSPGLKQLAQSHEGVFQTLGSAISSKIGDPIYIFFEGGTRDEPMTIANWFQIGVPGEMPG